MLIVFVYVHVKENRIDDFINATMENVKNSVQEKGVIRFDFVQNNEDSSRFVLIEIYRDNEATVNHKATAHYAKWKETVEEMMAEPRKSMKYTNIFPEEKGWEYAVQI